MSTRQDFEDGLTGTERYYRERALEYDRVYDKPERQRDLHTLKSSLPAGVEGRHVIEIAAGTGYWTQFMAESAASVTATDINDAVLNVARSRRSWPATVTFQTANGFDLGTVPGTFNAAFVGFFWSHLKLDQLHGFLSHLADRLEPSSRILFVDNRYVHGSNHPITKTDPAGNTYQRRRLTDGTEWDVLKNFPSRQDITSALAGISTDIKVDELKYYWTAECETLARS